MHRLREWLSFPCILTPFSISCSEAMHESQLSSLLSTTGFVLQLSSWHCKFSCSLILVKNNNDTYFRWHINNKKKKTLAKIFMVFPDSCLEVSSWALIFLATRAVSLFCVISFGNLLRAMSCGAVMMFKWLSQAYKNCLAAVINMEMTVPEGEEIVNEVWSEKFPKVNKLFCCFRSLVIPKLIKSSFCSCICYHVWKLFSRIYTELSHIWINWFMANAWLYIPSLLSWSLVGGSANLTPNDPSVMIGLELHHTGSVDSYFQHSVSPFFTSNLENLVFFENSFGRKD